MSGCRVSQRLLSQWLNKFPALVPAALLMRVLRRQEGDLENLVGQAWEAGRPTPESLKQALHDVRMLMERI
ncbi:hypothetical protein QCK34_004523 [Enterobacter asburiae]|nr:DUF1380 family protein [Enterobacter asburiae]